MQPEIGHIIKGSDGKQYAFHIDELQRRWWRAVDDHTKLIPFDEPSEATGGISSNDRVPRQRSAWERGLDVPCFKGLFDD